MHVLTHGGLILGLRLCIIVGQIFWPLLLAAVVFLLWCLLWGAALFGFCLPRLPALRVVRTSMLGCALTCIRLPRVRRSVSIRGCVAAPPALWAAGGHRRSLRALCGWSCSSSVSSGPWRCHAMPRHATSCPAHAMCSLRSNLSYAMMLMGHVIRLHRKSCTKHLQLQHNSCRNRLRLTTYLHLQHKSCASVAQTMCICSKTCACLQQNPCA